MYSNKIQYTFVFLVTSFYEPIGTIIELRDSFKDKYSCILGVIILLCNHPVTLLITAPDKRGIEDNSKIIFRISH